MQVAKTILEQLGGNRFLIMTGSKNLIAKSNGLSMRLSRNKSGANYLNIELTPMDTYKMTFSSIRNFNITTKKELNDIYFDQLQEIFTDITGLYTRL